MKRTSQLGLVSSYVFRLMLMPAGQRPSSRHFLVCNRSSVAFIWNVTQAFVVAFQAGQPSKFQHTSWRSYALAIQNDIDIPTKAEQFVTFKLLAVLQLVA